MPLIVDLAKTDEQRQILRLIFARQVMGRPFVAPPNIPRDRAEALRKAFMDTMKDKDFLADAEKAQLEITPVPGDRDREAGEGNLRARRREIAQKASAASALELAIHDNGNHMDAKVTNYTGWQSDVIVDLIKRYDFPYITLNPGASFRGLHDSLVNYGDNEPPMMLCNHEEIAVQIAHGYAKASGKPMAVILHNLVGLLHACMAIYYAYIDRVPIFIIGATGPMDESKRRPHIDWTHTALVQGNAVRDYVKWDYQPTSIEGVPESFARAYSIMMTEPQGPDLHVLRRGAAGGAEDRTTCRCRPRTPSPTPSPMAPDPRAIEAIADKLLKAEHPMLLPEYAGRRAGGFESIVELAETDRRGGVGRQQRAQLPEQAPAVPVAWTRSRSSTPT